MTRGGRAALAAALGMSVVASAAAQAQTPAPRHRRGAVTLSVGLGGSLANTLSGHCGTTASVGAIARDTTLVFGRDTVRAFLVPGHTAGSAAYLARGVLFVGDAASADHGGLRAARRGYSSDVALARSSLARLAAATAPHAPRLVCTAHARCAPSTASLWARVIGGEPDR